MCVAACLAGQSAVAQSSQAGPSTLTLPGALEQALQHRPLLTTDAERIQAAGARVQQARAALRPRVDLQATVSEGLPGAPQVFIGGLAGSPFKKRVGGSVTVTQTLLDFGRTRSTVLSRRADETASREALQADQNRVVLEVQQAYLQALQSRRLVAVNKQILEQRRLVVRQSATFQENGLASRVDVDLAQLNVSQAELAVVNAENELQEAYAALAAAMGAPVDPAVALEDVLDEKLASRDAGGLSIPATLDEAVAQALANRPELRQSETQARAFDHLADAARASKRPLLNVIGSVGKVHPGPLIENSDKPYAVALIFSAPLFTGGLIEAQVEEARRNAAAARGSRGELEQQIRQQVVSTFANLRASRERVKVATEQMATAADAMSLATQRYQAQLGSIVELTQAQVAYATAQNDLVRTHYDLELARAALGFATGQRLAGGKAGAKQ